MQLGKSSCELNTGIRLFQCVLTVLCEQSMQGYVELQCGPRVTLFLFSAFITQNRQ